jgi:hypothetical protein
MGQVEVQQSSKIAEGWRNDPFETFGSQQDICDNFISAADDPFPFAAVCAVHP